MKCPECDGEMELQDTKKSNMKKYVHKAGQKKPGCGVSFIPSIRKGEKNGGNEAARQTTQGGSQESQGERSTSGSGYREAVQRERTVKNSRGRGKSGRGPGGEGQKPVQKPAAGASTSAGASGDRGGKPKRSFLDGFTDNLRGNW